MGTRRVRNEPIPDPAEQFTDHAHHFRIWVLDGTDSGPDAARAALEHVTRLFLAALALPPVRLGENKTEEPDTSPEHADVYSVLAARLPFLNYSEVFNPLPLPPEEPVVGDLADDLADIFADMSKGLRCFEAGDRDAAVWWWSFGLVNHWGEHATSAVRALNCWLRETHPELLATKAM